jgi:hypothetical protein
MARRNYNTSLVKSAAAANNHPAVQRAVFALRHNRSLQRWLYDSAPPLRRVAYYYTPEGQLTHSGYARMLIPNGIVFIPDTTPPYCSRDTSYIVVGAEWPPLKKRLDDSHTPYTRDILRIQHYFSRVFMWRERRGLRRPLSARPDLAVVAEVWGCTETQLVEDAVEVCLRYWRRRSTKRQRQLHLLCGWSPPCVMDQHIWVGRRWLKRALRAAHMIQ